MTLKDLTDMTYDLALGHYINGEKFTRDELHDCLKHWLCKSDSSYVGTITLPDGEWYVRFLRHNHYYDLYVPDTREQESMLIQKLMMGVA